MKSFGIGHNGILVTFNRLVDVKHFIDGTPYVIIDPGASVEVVNYTPGPQAGYNLAMKNPMPGNRLQGLDSRGMLQTKYDASLSVTLPVQLRVGDTLVISTGEPTVAKFSNIQSAFVLKIMDRDVGRAFRPAITSFRTKCYTYPEKPVTSFKLATNNPRINNLTPMLKLDLRVLLNDSWTSQYIVPRDLFPALGDKGQPNPQSNDSGYGVVIAHHIGEALQLLMHPEFEDTIGLKDSIVQLGIDHYHNAIFGGQWHPDGGHMQGMKALIFAAGFFLDREEFYDLPDIFAEDGQTYYAAPNLPEWGIRHKTHPAQDLPWFDVNEPDVPPLNPNEHRSIGYRNCCTANVWACWLPFIIGNGLQKKWKNDALFDYFNRYSYRQKYGPWPGGDYGDWSGKDGADRIFDHYYPVTVLNRFIDSVYPTTITPNIKLYGFGNSDKHLIARRDGNIMTVRGSGFVPNSQVYLAIGEVSDTALDLLGAKVYSTCDDTRIMQTDRDGYFVFNHNVRDIRGENFCLQAGQIVQNKLLTSNAIVLNL